MTTLESLPSRQRGSAAGTGPGPGFLSAFLPFLLFSLLLAAVPSVLPGQDLHATSPLPGDHWAYDFLDALDVAGISSAWMADFRGVSEEGIQGEMDRILEFGFGRAALVRNWRRTFRRSRGLAPSTGSPPRLRLHLESGLREGEAWLNPGDGAFGRARGALSLGSGVEVWGELAVGGWDRFEGLRSAGVSVPAGPFSVTVGRQFLRAPGSGSTSPLLGGGTPLDGVFVLTDRPREFPGFGWLFGPVSWQFALGPLEGITGPDRGWIGLGSAVAQPHPRLRLGATRVVWFGGDQRGGYTLGRLARSVFLLQNEPFWWDDQKLEFTIRYDWGLGDVPFSTYLVLGQEDAPIYRDSGVVAGTRVNLLSSFGMTVLRYEYSAYGTRARWCPWCSKVKDARGVDDYRPTDFWYLHHRRWPYARDGIPLGDPLGGYGMGHTVGGRFWSAGGSFLAHARGFYQKREERNLLVDRWPGNRWGVEGGSTVFLPGAFRLSFSLLLTRGGEFGSEEGLFLSVGRAFSAGGSP